ncbi:class F sortase [Pengzhenrongella sicca]|uniref:Class F sortase n=1 Tax=Pengzhenrongella sicca TaxID=2819238 RepID=A0A8A4ZI51_9MICO|nr:class F sortase [Pengzhenrongella sicca]QTE29298.1 class F sortase [Pengzhenrongella sicca]
MAPGSPARRRGCRAAVAVLLAAALTGGLGACGAGPAPAPGSPPAATPATPTPTPSPSPPDGPEPTPVAVVRADLAAAAAPGTVAPVALTIAALGLEVPVDPVGVAPDGQMEIPPLAERAGWYRFGAAPGEPAGTAVIAAHVDSVASAGLGPFARLGDAAPGDAVDVVLADGSTLRYTVTAVERMAKPAVAWADVFRRDGSARLILVTCGGTFARDAGRYSDNVIVTSEPAGQR